MKKICAVILSMMIILPVLPISVFAEADDGYIGDVFREYVTDENGITTRIDFDEDGNPVEFENDTLYTAAASLPSSYDARTTGRVTSVKNQSPFGTCWTFAFCSSAESSLISQGYADTSIDLSEAHIAWFRAANYVAGSSIPVQQDRKILETGESTFEYGGNNYDAAATVARWSGFATEAQFPYSRTESAMQFSQSSMFVNNYNLTSMIVYDPAAERDQIKQAIIKNGALATSIYYDSSAIKTTSTYCTHYQNTVYGTNHAITCVGWDDNYPAANFKTTPPGNGAWLIKNSWGTGQNYQGYLWLSYYDTSISNFAEVNVKPAGDYDHNYQYDGCFYSGGVVYTGTGYAANIFTAEGNEKIKGCGFYTYENSNLTVTAKLYTNLSSASNPSSGTLRESKSITANHEGYYTIDFSSEYNISQGSKFAIVIMYKNADNSQRVVIPYENLTSDYYSYTVASNQSFYGSNGSTWKECKANSKGNIPIKAFTVDSNPITVSSIEIVNNPTKLSYFAGENLDITGLQVKAYYSDGTSGTVPVGDLMISGYNPTTAGTQTVTVSYGGKTASFSVTVTGVIETGIEIYSLPNKTTYFVGEDFAYTGLKIKVLYNDGTYVIKSGGFSLSIQSMNSPGLKTATVTYQDTYTATFNYTVLEIEIDSISIRSMPKTTFFVGDSADYSGLVLTAHYNNGTTQTVTQGYTCSGFDSSSVGVKTITVSYAGFTTQYSIEIVPINAILADDIVGIGVSVDYDEMLICGFFCGEDSIDDYISVKSGYTYSYSHADGKPVGTGEKLFVYKNGNLVETYEIVSYGDVNGDGWTDGTDAVIINTIAAGFLTKNAAGAAVYRAADCTLDGTVDFYDRELAESAGLLEESGMLSTLSYDEIICSEEYEKYCEVLTQYVQTEEQTVTQEIPEVPAETVIVPFWARIFEFLLGLIRSFFA